MAQTVPSSSNTYPWGQKRKKKKRERDKPNIRVVHMTQDRVYQVLRQRQLSEPSTQKYRIANCPTETSSSTQALFLVTLSPKGTLSEIQSCITFRVNAAALDALGLVHLRRPGLDAFCLTIGRGHRLEAHGFRGLWASALTFLLTHE